MNQYPCDSHDVKKHQKQSAIYVSYSGFSNAWNEWIFNPFRQGKIKNVMVNKDYYNLTNDYTFHKSMLQSLISLYNEHNFKIKPTSDTLNTAILNVINGIWLIDELFNAWTLLPVSPILYGGMYQYVQALLEAISCTTKNSETCPFHGHQKTTITCSECKHEQISIESVNSLKLSIPNKNTLSIMCDIHPKTLQTYDKNHTTTKPIRTVYTLSAYSTFRDLAGEIAKEFRCDIDQVIIADKTAARMVVIFKHHQTIHPEHSNH